MAHSAHKTDDELTEYFDAPDVLEKKIRDVVNWIKASKHCVVFTGAGISTSAGIPDFRGPTGVWTLAARGQHHAGGVSCSVAIPTYTHMALVELHKHGYVKHLISQNCDGLHRRSGFNPLELSELHGNSNTEKCIECGKEYLRDFDTGRGNADVHDHETGRLCDDPLCRGRLDDTIINFGENLPQDVLQAGIDNSCKSDLHIVLGSSLRVSPACHLPAYTADAKGKLVICNLQTTPLDHRATVVHSRVDDFMHGIMQGLGIEPTPFKLARRLVIKIHPTDDSQYDVSIDGLDSDGTPFAYLKAVEVIQHGKAVKHMAKVTGVQVRCVSEEKSTFRLHFQGHYGEPSLDIYVPLTVTGDIELALLLEFDVLGTKKWTITDWQEEYQKVKAQLQQKPKPTVSTPKPQPPKRTPPPQATTPEAQAMVVTGLPVRGPHGVGFAVNPKRDCPHVHDAAMLSPLKPMQFPNTCGQCKDDTENWICLSCYQYFCSRYVNKHAAEHAEMSKHCIAVSFTDLSVWCYECDSYIQHMNLTGYLRAARDAKFAAEE